MLTIVDTPFKMEKFLKVDPVIKAKELENRVADHHQKEEKKAAKQ